jgi:hypothetical protein
MSDPTCPICKIKITDTDGASAHGPAKRVHVQVTDCDTGHKVTIEAWECATFPEHYFSPGDRVS